MRIGVATMDDARSGIRAVMYAGMLAGLVSSSAALALPRTAGEDPDFADAGLTDVQPIDGRGYQLEGNFDTLYDGNILRLGSDATVRPGQSRADYRFSPSITGAFGLPVGRQQFFVGGLLGHDFYARNTNLDRDRYSIGGGFNLRAGSRCTGAVAANYSSREALLSETSELVPNSRETLSYGGEATCQAATGLGFGGTVRRIEVSNTNSVRTPYDVDTTVFAPQISYSRPQLGTFSISGSYNESRYPNRTIIATDGATRNDGVNILSGRFGYNRQVGTRLTVTAGLSYLQAKPQPGTVLVDIALPPPLPPLQVPQARSSFSGLGYDLAVEYDGGARFGGSIVANRDVTASTNVGAQYVIQQSYGADVTYKLGRAIDLELGGTYSIRDYRNSFTVGTDTVRRINDNIVRVYGRIGFQPVKLYSVALLLAYQNRDSNPSAYSYDAFSALLSLSVTFGRHS